MGSGLLRGTWYGVWVSRRRANGGGDGDFSDKFEGECGEDEGAIWRLGFCASIWGFGDVSGLPNVASLYLLTIMPRRLMNVGPAQKHTSVSFNLTAWLDLSHFGL